VQLFETPSKSHTSYEGLKHVWYVVKSIDDDPMGSVELATYMRERERERERGGTP
jgi:hypothetical protein